MRNWYVTGDADEGTLPTFHVNVGVTDDRGPVTGAIGMTPIGKVAAAVTSGRPQPRSESGAARFAPQRRNAARSSIGVIVGCSCLTSAALAASSGVANDVPLRRPTRPPPVAAQTSTPGAAKSGFMRPSAVGPREEKFARPPNESSAPTARTESPSAGVQ